MDFKSKFNLGDTVYPITLGTKEVTTPCPTCDGSGEIHVKGAGYRCPECYGSGTHTEVEKIQWRQYPELVGTIGRITVEVYHKKYSRYEDQTRYMLSSTGVGSGTLWDEDTLFSSLEEAEKECERRNNEEKGD